MNSEYSASEPTIVSFTWKLRQKEMRAMDRRLPKSQSNGQPSPPLFKTSARLAMPTPCLTLMVPVMAP